MPTAVVQNPEVFGDSLAQVLHKEGGKVSVLGQAWLIGPGQLATCGHVVEAYTHNSQALLVKFPASGNEYVAKEIRLHPKFLRQADQLVKYDAALIIVDLKSPETESAFLPLRFEKSLRNQQTLFAMRYPAHLGVLSTAPNPLIQEGHFLGPLRKDDDFHLLHDLGLAPGDSGSPLFDNETVVAIHCGDTASIPGLNLPTTSIRLALNADALRDLGIAGNQNRIAKQRSENSSGINIFDKKNLVPFIASCALSMFLVSSALIVVAELSKSQAKGAIAPLAIHYEELSGIDEGKYKLVINSQGKLRLYAIFEGPEHTSLVYPRKEDLDTVSDSSNLSFEVPKDFVQEVSSGRGRLLLAVLKPDYKLISSDDLVVRDPSAFPIFNDNKKTMSLLGQFEKDGKAILQEIPPPLKTISSKSP